MDRKLKKLNQRKNFQFLRSARGERDRPETAWLTNKTESLTLNLTQTRTPQLRDKNQEQ